MEQDFDKHIGEVLLNNMLIENNEFSTIEGKIEIPVEGNLGLLATGYKGIVAWRMARIATNYQSSNIIVNQSQEKAK